MAYIVKINSDKEKWYGPCSNKTGEFCGNAIKDDLEIAPNGTVLNCRRRHHFRYPYHEMSEDITPVKRIGKPSNCKGGSSKQMAKQGFVGLYLLHDHPLNFPDKEREVDTDVLLEEVVTGQRRAKKPFRPNVPIEK